MGKSEGWGEFVEVCGHANRRGRGGGDRHAWGGGLLLLPITMTAMHVITAWRAQNACTVVLLLFLKTCLRVVRLKGQETHGIVARLTSMGKNAW